MRDKIEPFGPWSNVAPVFFFVCVCVLWIGGGGRKGTSLKIHLTIGFFFLFFLFRFVGSVNKEETEEERRQCVSMACWSLRVNVLKEENESKWK